MTFVINMQELRELAAKRVATVASLATLLTPSGSKVARLAGVAGVAEDSGAPAVCAEFADTRKPENDPQARANACDSQNSQNSQGGTAKTCAGCSNRSKHGTCGEPAAAGLAPKFEIRWAPAGHAQTCPAYIAEAPTPAQDRPYRVSKDAADRCHLGGWNDAEIELFTTRTLHFIRRGITVGDADDLAERLTLRDRDGDDLRMCIECKHGRGACCPGGSPLPVGLLTRCPGFENPNE